MNASAISWMVSEDVELRGGILGAISIVVPRLASPTVHEPSRWIPTSFESLLALQVKKGQPESKDEDEKGDLAFLSKVKGLKSLNLELSWRYVRVQPWRLSGIVAGGKHTLHRFTHSHL